MPDTPLFVPRSRRTHTEHQVEKVQPFITSGKNSFKAAPNSFPEGWQSKLNDAHKSTSTNEFQLDAAEFKPKNRGCIAYFILHKYKFGFSKLKQNNKVAFNNSFNLFLF